MTIDDAARAERAAELLDSYYQAVLQNPGARPPVELDAGLAETARRLARGLAAPEAEAGFSEGLHGRLVREAQKPSRHPGVRKTESGAWWRRLATRWPVPALAPALAAALVTVAALGIYLLALRPEPVSAQVIIQKAQAAATSPVAGGVRTFVLKGTWQAQLTNARMNAVSGYQGDEQITGETKRWFQAPDRWRSESQVKILRPDGTEAGGYTTIEASDGTDVWQYDPDQNTVTVNQFDPAMNGKGEVSSFGEGVDNLERAVPASQHLLRSAGDRLDNCRRPAGIRGEPGPHEMPLGLLPGG